MIAATLALSGLLLASTTPLPEATRWVMGTTLRVVLGTPGLEPERADAILDEVFAEAQRWDALLSNYDPDSPLSAINAAAGQWVPVPADLIRYLERARNDAHRTDGVFDITAGSRLRDPSLTAGIQFLQTEPARARLLHENMALDPGGDGKGVAVDAAVEILRRHGVDSALIDFGGSSWYGLGRPPDGNAWQVGITNAHGIEVGRVRLVDRALATSASHHTDASRPEAPSPHILDPRTGEVVTSWRSVAAISPSATDAEVLSTALVVEGIAGFRWLASFDGAHAVVTDDREPPRLSPGATAWVTVP